MARQPERPNGAAWLTGLLSAGEPHGPVGGTTSPFGMMMLFDFLLLETVASTTGVALREHPLPAMLGEGLYVTVNSDDPPMFGTTLSNEYLIAGTVPGMPATGLAALADNAVRASFLDQETKKSLSGEIAAVLADHR